MGQLQIHVTSDMMRYSIMPPKLTFSKKMIVHSSMALHWVYNCPHHEWCTWDVSTCLQEWINQGCVVTACSGTQHDTLAQTSKWSEVKGVMEVCEEKRGSADSLAKYAVSKTFAERGVWAAQFRLHTPRVLAVGVNEHQGDWVERKTKRTHYKDERGAAMVCCTHQHAGVQSEI
ncbi:hypothetical protein K439DRAFT_1550678 [Ramaria rubella]|nr:hypothetical protein K439DRAFT_1550678 [Ramaria rubella]